MQPFEFLIEFADRHNLIYKSGESSEGLAECYVYSRTMRYRYAFARCWDSSGPQVLWIGVNPGKGDTEKRRRPTVERCINWTRLWGAGGLMFGNLFAERHNKPSLLRAASNPIGPNNDEALTVLGEAASRIVAAWGNWGSLQGRAMAVTPRLRSAVCFGATAKGQPRHPLYVPSTTNLAEWPTLKALPKSRNSVQP